ncbi:hypothetical protein TNCV_2773451 [Trichonephila clavipes]|nr:hypothetical protein TNCV_2773451 [Trichonephila clavipes]
MLFLLPLPTRLILHYSTPPPPLKTSESLSELKIDSVNSGMKPDTRHTNAKLMLSLGRSGKKSKNINSDLKDFLLTLNPEENSLYNLLHRKFSKRHIPLPPLLSVEWPIRISKRREAAFKDTLEVTFQKMKNPTVTTRLKKLKV